MIYNMYYIKAFNLHFILEDCAELLLNNDKNMLY